MFRKILVPLDGSDLAEQILPQVVDLAKSMEAEVTLITIGSIQISGLGREFMFGGYEGLFAQLKAEAEKSLSKTGNELRDKGVKTTWLYQEGQTPAQEILSYAEKNSFDLIAMATHGKGEMAWLIGSVAEKVVTHAMIPVLLLRVLGGGSPMAKG